jgi:hypothetical protein
MERDINKLIEQVLAIHAGEKLLKAHSLSGEEVWVSLDRKREDALELATGPEVITPETFELFARKHV